MNPDYNLSECLLKRPILRCYIGSLCYCGVSFFCFETTIYLDGPQVKESEYGLL